MFEKSQLSLQVFPLFPARKKDGLVPVFTTVLAVEGSIFAAGQFIIRTNVGEFKVSQSCPNVHRLGVGVSALLLVTPNNIFETRNFKPQTNLFSKPLQEIKEIFFPEDGRALYELLSQ